MHSAPTAILGARYLAPSFVAEVNEICGPALRTTIRASLSRHGPAPRTVREVHRAAAQGVRFWIAADTTSPDLMPALVQAPGEDRHVVLLAVDPTRQQLDALTEAQDSGRIVLIPWFQLRFGAIRVSRMLTRITRLTEVIVHQDAELLVRSTRAGAAPPDREALDLISQVLKATPGPVDYTGTRLVVTLEGRFGHLPVTLSSQPAGPGELVITFRGENGTVTISGNRHATRAKVLVGGGACLPVHEFLPSPAEMRGQLFIRAGQLVSDPHAHTRSEDPPLPTLSDARRWLEVTEAARRSRDEARRSHKSQR